MQTQSSSHWRRFSLIATRNIESPLRGFCMKPQVPVKWVVFKKVRTFFSALMLMPCFTIAGLWDLWANWFILCSCSLYQNHHLEQLDLGRTCLSFEKQRSFLNEKINNIIVQSHILKMKMKKIFISYLSCQSSLSIAQMGYVYRLVTRLSNLLCCSEI